MASGSEEINVSIKTAKQKIDISLKSSANVKELKEEVLKHFTDTEYTQLCLIYSGKILKDDETLASHNIRSGCSVHLVIRQSKSGSTAATSTTSTSSSSSTSTTTASSNTQSTATSTATPEGTSVPLGGMPMGGNLEQQMSQLQQQMRANPELMSQMLNNPMMQNLMNSPDMMSSLLQSNPQMRELMERNPELNHILNNPDMMRQAMEMMRNPAMFQEMLRSHDRQLSNIESMPGGFNALARMYTEIQEPMMDVAQETLEQQNPFSALFGGSSTPPPGPTTPQGAPNTNPLPNPWAPSTTDSTSQASTTTTTTTSSSTTSTSSSPFGSMFGGPGGMGGMSPGMMGDPMRLMQNPELMSQLMQSPMFQQSMQMMMSNPQLMEQMLMSNPMLAGNPMAQQRVRQTMQMMQNEDFRRLLSNPDYIRAMSNISAGMQDLERLGVGPGLFGNPGGTSPNPSSTTSHTSTGSLPSSSTSTTTTMPSSTATTTASSGGQPGQQQLMQAFMQTFLQQQQQQQQQQQPQPSGGSGGGLFTPASMGGPGHINPVPNVEQRQVQEAERLYQSQLQELEAMGFYDRQRNLRALIDTGGDLNAAVNLLL